MRADRKSMSFIAQALEIKQQSRIGWQRYLASAREMKDLAPLAAMMRTLGDAHDRDVVDTRVLQHLADRRKLALAAVDQQQFGPFAAGAIRVLLLEPGETPLQHLAHHGEIVARLRLRPLDVELAIAVLAEP